MLHVVSTIESGRLRPEILEEMNSMLSDTSPIEKSELLRLLHVLVSHIHSHLKISLEDTQKHPIILQITNGVANIFRRSEKLNIDSRTYQTILRSCVDSLSNTKLEDSQHIPLQCSLFRVLTGLFLYTKRLEDENIRSLVVLIKRFIVRTGNAVSWKLAFHSGECLGALSQIIEAKKQLWSLSISSLLFPVSALAPMERFTLHDKAVSRLGHSFSLYLLLTDYTDEKTFVCHCKALGYFIENSKWLLINADDRISDALYIGYSQQIGVALFQIHFGVLRSLHELLSSLDSAEYLVRVRCLFLVLRRLLANVPYEKLSDGYLSCIGDLISSYILSSIPISSRVLVEILQSLELLVTIDTANEIDKITSRGELLLNQLLYLLDNDNTVAQTLKCIACIYEKYGTNDICVRFRVRLTPWFVDRLSCWIRSAVKNTSDVFIKALSRVISPVMDELWGQCFPKLLQHLGDENTPAFLQGSILTLFNYIDCCLFDYCNVRDFDTLCHIILAKTSQKSSYLRSLALEAMIAVTARNSHERNSKFMKKVIISFARALEPSESNAMRTRASFLLYNFIPFLKEFDNEAIWMKATWLFGSLEESLLVKYPEKLQLSTIRTLGQLGMYANLQFLLFTSPCNPKLIAIRLCNILIGQLGFSHHVKIQWNACVALGTILKNKKIYETKIMEVIEEVIINLANVMWQSENVKIRIHAAKALSVPEKAEHYGNTISKVHESILIAEDNVELIPNLERITMSLKSQFNQELRTLHAHISSISDINNI